MLEAEAKQRIERLCAAEFDPKLDDDDLADLLKLSERTDADGESAWNIPLAVSRGWEIKAARAAGDYRFEEDNQVFYREQVADHCMKMAARWNRGMVAVEHP